VSIFWSIKWLLFFAVNRRKEARKCSFQPKTTTCYSQQQNQQYLFNICSIPLHILFRAIRLNSISTFAAIFIPGDYVSCGSSDAKPYQEVFYSYHPESFGTGKSNRITFNSATVPNTTATSYTSSIFSATSTLLERY
jgi:hypothetical protein